MKKREEPSVAEYEAMGYEKLHETIVDMIVFSAPTPTHWCSKAKRFGLLPAAMTAMENLTSQPVAGMPSWQEECLLLKTTPEQLRQWRSRMAASEVEIRHLLGEVPNARSENGVPTDAQAKRHLRALAQLTVNDDDDKAYQMARAIVEMYPW